MSRAIPSFIFLLVCYAAALTLWRYEPVSEVVAREAQSAISSLNNIDKSLNSLSARAEGQTVFLSFEPKSAADFEKIPNIKKTLVNWQTPAQFGLSFSPFAEIKFDKKTQDLVDANKGEKFNPNEAQITQPKNSETAKNKAAQSQQATAKKEPEQPVAGDFFPHNLTPVGKNKEEILPAEKSAAEKEKITSAPPVKVSFQDKILGAILNNKSQPPPQSQISASSRNPSIDAEKNTNDNKNSDKNLNEKSKPLVAISVHFHTVDIFGSVATVADKSRWQEVVASEFPELNPRNFLKADSAIQPGTFFSPTKMLRKLRNEFKTAQPHDSQALICSFSPKAAPIIGPYLVFAKMPQQSKNRAIFASISLDLVREFSDKNDIKDFIIETGDEITNIYAKFIQSDLDKTQINSIIKNAPKSLQKFSNYLMIRPVWR